jgi:hypothetical protein
MLFPERMRGPGSRELEAAPGDGWRVRVPLPCPQARLGLLKVAPACIKTDLRSPDEAKRNPGSAARKSKVAARPRLQDLANPPATDDAPTHGHGFDLLPRRSAMWTLADAVRGWPQWQQPAIMLSST